MQVIFVRQTLPPPALEFRLQLGILPAALNMASSVPLQVAETVQTAHLNPEPASEHDINPSTAASKRVPATFEEYPLGDFHDDSIDEDERDGRRAEGDESIPYSVVRPKRRSSHLPPLPDLRFEQSYLHSISQTTSWQGLAWITVRDQVRSTESGRGPPFGY